MKVKVFPYREGLCYGNIIWPGKFPMRAGNFPSNHPVAASARENGTTWIGNEAGRSALMDKFRALGYWASCFPEGDGITWKPLNGQTWTQITADIANTFGWELEY